MKLRIWVQFRTLSQRRTFILRGRFWGTHRNRLSHLLLRPPQLTSATLMGPKYAKKFAAKCRKICLKKFTSVNAVLGANQTELENASKAKKFFTTPFVLPTKNAKNNFPIQERGRLWQTGFKAYLNPRLKRKELPRLRLWRIRRTLNRAKWTIILSLDPNKITLVSNYSIRMTLVVVNFFGLI